MSEIVRHASLTMHAERLQRDHVWDVVSATLAALERHGMRATVFVHPWEAILAGADLGPRLRELADRGHEIGQHTHYYSVSAGRTVTNRDLSPSRIRACLDRDFGYLEQAGLRPRGYVSGGWAIHDEIYTWLRERGFDYDCSYRTYELGYRNPNATQGDRASGPFLREGVLVVPTTGSLGDSVRGALMGRRRHVEVGSIRYELWYLHDTDLIAARARVGLRALRPILMRGRRWMPVSELAERVRTARSKS